MLLRCFAMFCYVFAMFCYAFAMFCYVLLCFCYVLLRFAMLVSVFSRFLCAGDSPSTIQNVNVGDFSHRAQICLCLARPAHTCRPVLYRFVYVLWYREIFRKIPQISRTFPGFFPEISRNFPEISRKYV